MAKRRAKKKKDTGAIEPSYGYSGTVMGKEAAKEIRKAADKLPCPPVRQFPASMSVAEKQLDLLIEIRDLIKYWLLKE